MKRLYILGNGFDLYMGMKTSYNNFFENGGYSSIKKKLISKIEYWCYQSAVLKIVLI